MDCEVGLLGVDLIVRESVRHSTRPLMEQRFKVRATVCALILSDANRRATIGASQTVVVDMQDSLDLVVSGHSSITRNEELRLDIYGQLGGPEAPS